MKLSLVSASSFSPVCLSRSTSAFLFAVAAFTGCGSSNANTSEPAVSHGASAEQPTEPAPEPVVLPLDASYDDATARSCSAPSDCTLVPGVCGGWVGANLAHADGARVHWAQLAMAASCVANADPSPAMGASCNDGLCEPVELANPEWRACTTATDCVAVHDVCGGVDAVNRASEAPMRAAIEERSMRVRCMSTTEGPLPTPVCRASFCAAY